MTIFTHYARVLEADGSLAPARSARIIEFCTQRDTGKARTLAYRLYSLVERKREADEAHACNILVASWLHIQAGSAWLATGVPEQAGFEFSGEKVS